MKKTILFFYMLFILAWQLPAQQCAMYFPMEKSRAFEMATFNEKDKPTGTVKYLVKDVQEAGGKTIATVLSTYFDKKGKEQFSGDYEVTCDGDNIYVDMSAYVNQQLEAFKNMDITMTAEDFVLPTNLSVGTAIKDAQVVATMNSNGTRFGTMTLTSQNKKVVSQEEVTVPAGTFDCYKIEGNMVSKTETMGIPMTFEFKNVEWYAKGVGLVRTESYGKNGKLVGYTVLSSK